MVTKLTSRNQSQQIGSFLRGSVITVLGNTGTFTEAAVFNGIVSTYEPPPGKRARIKGVFACRLLGTNTFVTCRMFDQNAGQFIDLVSLTANHTQERFEIELEPDNVIVFTGDNEADDGTASCIIEIEELPI